MKYIKRFAGCLGILGTLCFGMGSFVTANSQEIVVSHAENGVVPSIQLTPIQQSLVSQAETWMNSLTTLKAKFQQIASDNKRSTGTVWIKRPGRIRFEYDKPSQLLLVANDGKMVFHDAEVDQTTSIPLDQSPLGLLLKPELKFSGDVTITNFTQSNNGLFQITVVRTASPADGSLTLVFNENPVMLRAWAVLDAQNQQTTVNIYDLQPGVSVSKKLFKLDFTDKN